MLLAVCGDPSERAGEPGGIQYRLAWDTSGALPHEEGGWLLPTADGATVWLQTGWLVSYSAELVQCETSAGLLGWLSPRAHAGHGDPYDNEARFAGPVAEDVVAAREGVWAEASVPDYRFCQLHYLVARADAGTGAPSSAPELGGTSVLLRGQRLVEGEWVHFEFQTGQATATLVDIDAVDTGESAVQVTIERDLSGLFAGVDFDASDVAIARQVLRNLREQTRVTVRPLR